MSDHPLITTGRENGRKRPRGYADWAPRPKQRAIIAAVVDILEEYEDHLPLTVRQIFYRLVASYDYEKTEPAYKRLADYLVSARRAQMVPFWCIRDDGVLVSRDDWHDGPEDFWDDTGRRIKQYRRNRQAGQPQYIEVWCEAAGMVPQLAAVAGEYSVPVYSTGGFSSLTAISLIAKRATNRETATVLLHVGDFDPSGKAVFTAMVEDAAAFVEADRVIFPQRIVPMRVALTEDQVNDYDLPTSPPKKSDSRSASWIGETCQLEALAPDELASIVREEIECVMDGRKLAQQIEREEDDRLELGRALPRGGAT